MVTVSIGQTLITTTDLTASGTITDGTASLISGALSGATSIDGTGDLTIGTITMTGFTVDADGDTVVKSLNNTNGGITNTGAVAGATTVNATGAITGGSLTDGTASLSTGALTGAISVTASGNVQGGTITDGTASLSGGALSGATSVTAMMTVQGGTITDGTASLSNGALSDVTSIGASGVVSLTNNTTSTGIGNGALTLAGGMGISENLNIGGNMILTGNLTVNGTTTTINSTVKTIKDPVMALGEASDDSKDRGIQFHHGVIPKIGFFGMDQGDNKFTFIPDATDTSSAHSGTVGGVKFGTCSLSDTTQSTSRTTGSLTITGGVGVTKDIHADSLHYHSNISAASDRNLKKDITNLVDPLERLNKLGGYDFKWKSSNKEDVGVIAQEVREVYPRAVVEGENHLRVDYPRLVPLLIEAVKELSGKVDSLQNELAVLKA